MVGTPQFQPAKPSEAPYTASSCEPTGVRNRLELVPLSFGQERLWFFEQLAPRQCVYNQHKAYRLIGELDVEALEKSFSELVRRHEVLRTSIGSTDGNHCQIVHPPSHIALPTISVLTHGCELDNGDIECLIRAEMKRAFDLSTDVLIRPCLLRLAEGDHVLIWTTHHIAVDGWSTNILRKELSTLYEAFIGKLPIPLPPLRAQYSDYCLWQRESLTANRRDALLRYWSDALHDVPDKLEIPTDRPRPMGMSFRAKHCPITLSPVLSAGIRAMATKHRATPFMVLLAALQVLLLRYTGQRAVQVGAPIAGRSHPDFEANIGLFINVLCLAARFTEGMTFEQFLLQVRTTCLKAFEHQELPFEMLVEHLRPDRTLSHHPFVQVLFGLQAGYSDELKLSKLNCSPIPTAGSKTVFDLEVQLNSKSDMYTGMFLYNSDMWEKPTIKRFIGHYERILESVIENPDQLLTNICFLGSEEKFQVEVAWSSGAKLEVPERLVHEMIEDQVVANSGAKAVFFENSSLDYAELNHHANRLARHLLISGVGQGARVGVFIDRSLDSLISLLAILKAGAAYVPLDPAEPMERLRLIVSDAELTLVITRSNWRKELAFCHAIVLDLDESWQAIAAHTEGNPDISVNEHQPAYVIYTSGSTGVPKGVVIEHQALAATFAALRKQPGISSTDHLLCVTPVTFDISLLELLLPLTVGASLEIISRPRIRNAQDLCLALENSRATIMQATPVMWQMIVDAGWRGRSQLKILCGGETLSQSLAGALLERCGQLWNMYGPTETTIWSTIQPIVAPEDARSIGKPIANARVFVLDESLQPTPIGIPGELYIGGPSLARGYHRQATLTCERFIDDPFEPGSRLYRTGDRVRWQGNGTLEFLGRLDSQIKLRGYRIELPEIETQISNCPGVEAAAVVVADGHSQYERSIVGYWAKRSGAELNNEIIRRYLIDRLPSHMLPTQLIQLDEMPLTTSGKIDRGFLKNRPFQQLREQPGAMLSHSPYVQQQIGQIWKELLGRQDVGPTTEFFKFGGNSLMALRVVARIKERLGLDVPLRCLFEATTLHAFASVVEKIVSEPRSAPATIALNTVSPTPKHLQTLRSGSVPTVLVLVGQLRGVEKIQNIAPTTSFVWVMTDGLYTNEFEDLSFIEQARRYADELLTSYPNHRHVVIGYCISGLIAYALGSELRQRGSHVPALVLFEPTVPPRYSTAKNITTKQIWQGDLTSDLSPLQSFFGRIRYNIQFTAERVVCRSARLLGWSIPEQLRWNYYFSLSYQAACHFDIRPFDGRIGLVGNQQYCAAWEKFWASQTLRSFTACHLRSTDHLNIFDAEHSNQWAPWLDQYIREILNDKLGPLN